MLKNKGFTIGKCTVFPSLRPIIILERVINEMCLIQFRVLLRKVSYYCAGLNAVQSSLS